MSLTSPRFTGSMVAVALAGATITSCSQQPSPTSPSAVGVSAAVQPAAEYWVTLFDETTPGAPTAPLPSGSAATARAARRAGADFALDAYAAAYQD
jgi:ABC-type phosphate transport system substrate-binding protein